MFPGGQACFLRFPETHAGWWPTLAGQALQLSGPHPACRPNSGPGALPYKTGLLCACFLLHPSKTLISGSRGSERKALDPPCVHRASFRASLAPPSTSLSELHPVTFFLSLGNAQIPAILSLLHTPPPTNTHSFQLSQFILRPLPTSASPGSLSSTSWLVRFCVYSTLSWEVHLSSVPGSRGWTFVFVT